MPSRLLLLLLSSRFCLNDGDDGNTHYTCTGWFRFCDAGHTGTQATISTGECRFGVGILAHRFVHVFCNFLALDDKIVANFICGWARHSYSDCWSHWWVVCIFCISFLLKYYWVFNSIISFHSNASYRRFQSDQNGAQTHFIPDKCFHFLLLIHPAIHSVRGHAL